VPATTLKLSEDLKRRLAKVARARESTVHAFMVEAVERATELAERRQEMIEAAVEAREGFARSRLGVSMENVADYARRRVKSSKAKRPRAVRWP